MLTLHLLLNKLSISYAVLSLLITLTISCGEQVSQTITASPEPTSTTSMEALVGSGEELNMSAQTATTLTPYSGLSSEPLSSSNRRHEDAAAESADFSATDTLTLTNHDLLNPLNHEQTSRAPAIAHSLPPHGQKSLAHPNMSPKSSLNPADASLMAHIELGGLKFHRGGHVCIAVYNTSETFLTENFVISQCNTLTPHNNTVAIPLGTPGHYAFSVLHDEDFNDRLTTNILGIPREGFGFSNNPKILTGPPTFTRASTLINETKTVFIKMKYYL